MGAVLVRLVSGPLEILSVIVIVLLVAAAVAAPLLAPYDPSAADGFNTLRGPSASNLLGTDFLGRDVLSRLIYGAQVTAAVAVGSVAISVVFGVPLGLLSGYFKGLTDTIIMRFIDALYAFPPLLLSLVLVAMLGPSMYNVMIAVGVIMIPTFCRLARAQALVVSAQTYVVAAQTIGTPAHRIILWHLWPNIAAPVIVQLTIGMAWAILAEAALSYLGVGVRPPTPTWGVMLAEGFQYLRINPWLSFIPGMAIFLTVFALNILGDALRDGLDPRLRN